MSWVETVTEHVCGQVARAHPIIVSLPALRDALWHAADATGAFSQANPAWVAAAKEGGVVPPTYEEWTAGRPNHLLAEA